jgi:uncharacterized protein GlcG (DUF336 family)
MCESCTRDQSARGYRIVVAVADRAGPIMVLPRSDGAGPKAS